MCGWSCVWVVLCMYGGVLCIGGLVYGWSCLSSSVRNMMYMYSLCMRVYV